MTRKPDDLDIPEFLRATEKTPEERMARWDRAHNGRPPVAAVFIKEREVDESTRAYLAQRAEEDRVRTANRIAKMKDKLKSKHIDRKVHEWDFRRGGYRWRDTGELLQFNPDGSVRPRG